MPRIEGFKFETAREEGQSLREIKESSREKQAALRKDISDSIIASLNSSKGLKIVEGDTLNHINAITVAGNRLNWNNEADTIEVGDIIKIKNGEVFRNDTLVGNVAFGFNITTQNAIQAFQKDVVRGITGKKKTNGKENTRSTEIINRGYTLASFIKSEGYPKYGSANQCGKNVGDLLLNYGRRYDINGLPRSGRHGYKWTSFLNNRSNNFVKEVISKPSDAKKGGILVYDKGYGSGDRQDFGHVEIALGGGKFYFGNVRSYPGGSINANRNVKNSGFTGYVYYPVSHNNTSASV